MPTLRAIGLWGSCFAAIVSTLPLAACTSTTSQIEDGTAGGDGATTTGPAPTADTSSGSTSDAGTTTSSDGGSDWGGSQLHLPCDVHAVLSEHCADCHSDPPRFGAPMPLTRHEHVLAPLPSDPVQIVADGMAARIGDPDRPMPPTGTLPDSELQTLMAWLDDGAPGVDDDDCDIPEPDPEPGVGPEYLPCEPSVEIQAHGLNPDEPFFVPDTDDIYVCFNFPSPFSAAEQATAWAPIVDDDRVLHHWILFQTTEAIDYDHVGPCTVPEDANYLAGWAPGRENYLMPDDVGLELPDEDASLILEIHYNNVASYDDALDRSGIALCTTETPRPHTAGFFRLGDLTLDIPAGAEDHQETGMCPDWATAELPEPLHIISTFPHMHELGRAFYSEVLRGGDEAISETIVDVPQFSFDFQTGYPLDPPIVVQPGDAIRTTCTYDNPGDSDVGYGPYTADEMCFNRLLAYPVDTLPWRECIY